MLNAMVAGFLWKIRPLPGILQANGLGVAACPQNRGIIHWGKGGKVLMHSFIRNTVLILGRTCLFFLSKHPQFFMASRSCCIFGMLKWSHHMIGALSCSKSSVLLDPKAVLLNLDLVTGKVTAEHIVMFIKIDHAESSQDGQVMAMKRRTWWAAILTIGFDSEPMFDWC